RRSTSTCKGSWSACFSLMASRASRLGFGFVMNGMMRRMRLLRTSRDKADPCGNQDDSQPPAGRDLLVQLVLRNEGQQNISQGSGGENISEIGPRESHHIAGKKCQQKQNSKRDPGIGNGQNDTRNIGEGDAAHLLHSA